MEAKREGACPVEKECELQTMYSRSQTDVSSTTPVSSGEKESVLRRVASMPLISSTYDMAASAYNSTKNHHPYVKSLCDVAEKGVKTLTEAAVNSARPILTKLEPQIVTASEYANKRLDTLQEKLPVLQMTADKVASDTKKLVSAKMASAKDAIADVLLEVLYRMAAAKVALGHGLTDNGEFSVGKLAAVGADAVLGMSEQLVTKYLPITDRELVEIAAALPHENGVPVQEHTYMFPGLEEYEEQLQEQLEVYIEHDHDHQNQDYLVRLGCLSQKFRKRAYYHSLEKMERARQKIRESLFRLHKTIVLIENAKQGVGRKLHEAQEKLSQMWLEWRKANSVTKADKDEVETQTLTMFQSMIQQLQEACQSLVSSIQGFPSSLQDTRFSKSTKTLENFANNPLAEVVESDLLDEKE